jgi:TetR/AcrR family transcriptional repressor of nem operon
MTGRPKIYDDNEVLKKAQQVFWEKGYTATSTEEVLTAMGIGRGSFYLAFEGGKKELFEKVIRRYHKESFERFEKSVNESDHPLEQIREFFWRITRADWKTHQQGCFVGNTVMEMALTDQYLENEAILLLKKTEALFASTIKKAQLNGQLLNKTDPDILAMHLITLWNGLNITRRMHPDNETLKQLIEMQLQVLT